MHGRLAERRALDEHADRLRTGVPSLVLEGEAGIGKTTLWRYGLDACRDRGALVLDTRPGEEDRHCPGQGLLDLFGPGRPGAGPGVGAALRDHLPVTDLSRLVLDHLRGLSAGGPVLLGVDDLPWLDELTLRTLRFSLRRLSDRAVSLLATARTWSPSDRGAPVPVPQLDCDVRSVPVPPMDATELRWLVRAAHPATTGPASHRIGLTAHGNPLFALELARSAVGGAATEPASRSLSAALAARVSGLPRPTVHLARLLAVAGPTQLSVLGDAYGDGNGVDLADAVHAGLDSETFVLEADFVLRFAHPLMATAVLDATNPLDRCGLHGLLARTVEDPDAQAVHLARATVVPDAAVADRVEEAAARLARRGAPSPAAELLGHSARLTPADDVGARTRRLLGRVRHCAAAGDLGTALALVESLLADVGPGPLRAEVVSTRVELDFTDAEQFLRASLADLPAAGSRAVECVRGRLHGLLGWLLSLQLGRVDEGLRHAGAGLAVGRLHGDAVLTAQTAATVATASLLLGRRQDGLMVEAVEAADEVEDRHLVMWPRVLLGRQQLWDGHLAEARANHETSYQRTLRQGGGFQVGYRLSDLARLELAAGDLDHAERLVDDGLESTLVSGDQEAAAWLSYPGGLLAALRGDAEAAGAAAERLDRWAARVGERPRSAMAAHVRGALAAAARDWDGALEHHLVALAVLDDLGICHPGVVPVLPGAVQLAALADRPDVVDRLADRLQGQAASLAAPWVDAHVTAARGQQQLLVGDPASLGCLLEARQRLVGLGHHLDAARLGCTVAAAGLRWGHRRRVRAAVEESADLLAGRGVRGWCDLADELRQRVRGGGEVEELTTTERQVAGLVADGRRNKEIARALFVSESTVEAHLTRIYRRLGLRNRADLTRHLRQADGRAGAGVLGS